MKKIIALLSLVSHLGIAAEAIDANSLKIVSNCNPQDFVDMIPGDSIFTIATQGFSYSPKCLRLKKGSTINIQSSSHHAVEAINEANSTVVNPIAAQEINNSKTITVTFDEVGVFGYYCENHGNDNGEGMAGAILVVE